MSESKSLGKAAARRWSPVPEDYDSIMETLAILSDQELMGHVSAAEAETENGQISTLDEVTDEMRAAGQLPQ